VKATYNSDHYSHIDHRNPALEPAGVNRSSNGYQFDGGLDLLLGDLAQGEIYAGYLEQFYNKSQPHPLKDISGVDFGANVTWYPTELLTVHLAGQRQIENTTLTGVSGGDDRSGTLNVDYELLRRLHVLANVGYDDTAFRGSSPHREDQTFSAGIGGKFLLSHYAWINANYEYSNRSSTLGIAKYVDNFASVGLNLQD
jgi:hypothetical protein